MLEIIHQVNEYVHSIYNDSKLCIYLYKCTGVFLLFGSWELCKHLYRINKNTKWVMLISVNTMSVTRK